MTPTERPTKLLRAIAKITETGTFAIAITIDREGIASFGTNGHKDDVIRIMKDIIEKLEASDERPDQG